MVSAGFEDETLSFFDDVWSRKGQLDFSKVICLTKTKFLAENVCLFVLKKARRQLVNYKVSPLDGATFNDTDCQLQITEIEAPPRIRVSN